MAPNPPDQGAISSSTSIHGSRSKVLFGGRLLLAVVLLWLLSTLGLLDAAPLLVLLDSPWLLAVSALLLIAIHPLTALRWHILMRTQDIRLTYLNVFRVNYACSLLGLFLPGSVGGDVARVALGLSLARTQLSAFALSLAADRALGLLALLIVGFLAGLVGLVSFDAQAGGYIELKSLVFLVGIVLVAAAMVLLVVGLISKRLHVYCQQQGWPERGFAYRIIVEVVDATRLYSNHPRALVLALSLSLVVHIMSLAALTFISGGILAGAADPMKFATAGAIASIANVIPLTPGGLGVGEMAFSQLMLWLEPGSAPQPYASVFFAYRAVLVCTLLPALLILPSRLRRSS